MFPPCTQSEIFIFGSTIIAFSDVSKLKSNTPGVSLEDLVEYLKSGLTGFSVFSFSGFGGSGAGFGDKTDPRFIGAQAIAAWPTLGIVYSGVLVPLENAYSPGTDFHHWRESILTSEVMTGIIENAGVPMPLTALSIAALADLGYMVDISKGEPHLPNLLAPGAPQGGRIILREELFRKGVRIN
jgi:hypothetical protein